MLLPTRHAPDTVSTGVSLKISSASTCAFRGIASNHEAALARHRGLRGVLLRFCKSFVAVLQYLRCGSTRLLLRFYNSKRCLFGGIGEECRSARMLIRSASTFSARVWCAVRERLHRLTGAGY